MLTKLRKKFNLSDKAYSIIAGIVFIFLASAPFYMSSFRTNMLGKYMCFALVALGIDMIWGYTGILSLGQGVYFGIGAYCMAMHLKLEASGGSLPDFMAWSGMDKLPGFWKPFQSTAFTLFAVIALPILFASIIGTLTFLNRIRGVYFCILSQAIAYALATFLVGRQEYFGGSNGLTSFSTIFGHPLSSVQTKMVLFYVTLVFLIASYMLCRFIVKRRVGRVLVAIRDAENRARFTGYSPATYKVFVYCLSAVLAGIAGALYVPQVGIISPTDINITPSTEMVIWTAVGGKGTLVGPIIGALIVNFFKSIVSEQFPAFWQFFMGALCIVVVLFLPGGLISIGDVIKKHVVKNNKKIPDKTEAMKSLKAEPSKKTPKKVVDENAVAM